MKLTVRARAVPFVRVNFRNTRLHTLGSGFNPCTKYSSEPSSEPGIKGTPNPATRLVEEPTWKSGEDYWVWEEELR